MNGFPPPPGAPNSATGSKPPSPPPQTEPVPPPSPVGPVETAAFGTRNVTTPSNRQPTAEMTQSAMPAEVKPMDSDDIAFILDCNLAPKHRTDPNILKYISNYVVTRDNREASQAAGVHTNTGASFKRRKDVWNAIKAISDTAVLRYGLDPEEIVKKVYEVTQVDMIEFQKEDGSFVESLAEVRPEVRRAVKKFKAKNLYEKDPNGMTEKVGVLIEVEFYDKLKASEMVGRETNLFKETKVVEYEVSRDMKAMLLESKERAEAAALESRAAKEGIIDVTPAVTGEVVDGTFGS